MTARRSEASSEAVVEAKALLVRVTVWGQVVGFLLFGVSVMALDLQGFLREIGLPSLVWPVVLLIAVYATSFDILLARKIDRALLALFVIVVSLPSVVLTFGGALALRNFPEILLSEQDTPITESLIRLGMFYLGAFVANAILIGRTFRVRTDAELTPSRQGPFVRP